MTGTAGPVRSGVTGGQDAPNRVWAVRSLEPATAGGEETRDVRLSGLHARVREERKNGPLHGAAQNGTEAHGSEAESHSSAVAPAPPRANGAHGPVAPVGRARLLQRSRGTGQYAHLRDVPATGDSALAAAVAPTRTENPTELGTPGGTSPAVDSLPTHPASVPQRALRRHASEVRAVCGSAARTDLCGGRSAMVVPTATAKKLSVLTVYSSSPTEGGELSA